ncbi:MAG: hypothetical protein AB4372_02760 [Xenococcus sp. (in: cyanobacteria)]
MSPPFFEGIQIKQVLGAWQDDLEIDAIFAEIDRERYGVADKK